MRRRWGEGLGGEALTPGGQGAEGVTGGDESGRWDVMLGNAVGGVTGR